MSHREAPSYDEHEHDHDDPDHSDSNSTATDELAEESTEDDDCPLCMEPFDATDRQFTSCKCGYKICLWCWHSLNDIYTSSTASSSSTSSLLSSSSADRPPLAGRCPACRQPYQYPDTTFNAAALQSSLTAKQQKKAHRDKHKRDKTSSQSASTAAASSASASAASSASDPHSRSASDNNTRVLQRNLMYVANLPASVAKEELLEDKRYFGKFGKIVKIAITRKSGGGGGGGSGGSYSAYVTFKRAPDCAVALQMCHHTLLQGQVVKCMYGTTKYCPFWLRSVPCTMNRCGYLHALASAEDVVGKEELQAMEKKGDGDKPIPFPVQTTVTEALAAAKAYKLVQPAADDTDLHSSSSSSTSSSSSIAAASTSSSTSTPLASVWKLPAAPAISSSAAASASSATSASLASNSSIAAATSSSAATSASLRPYVSILAQSQNATHTTSSTTAPTTPSSSITNEIIRIVPSYLKDKFSPTATSHPQSSPAAPAPSATASSGRRKGGSASSTAAASPALSPASTASITASPSMSRSTSKASSASSRASSPVPSPLLQAADTSVASLSLSPPQPAPHSVRSVVSPPPPVALSPAASVASVVSVASSAASEQQQVEAADSAPTVPSAAEYQFDFLLYSHFDFSSFFSTYAANDPLFSWLCTPSHTAVHPFARARLPQQPQRSESRFAFARAGGDVEEGSVAVDSKEDGRSSVEGGVDGDERSKQAESVWNEQKVDPAAGQGAVMIQQVSSRRAR